MLSQQVVRDSISQFRLPVQRIFLVILHEFIQTLKRRCSNGEQSIFAIYPTVFHFSTGSVFNKTDHVI